jgi:DNA topoisomerase-1
VENGRWGPFIRFGKENITMKVGDRRMTAEEAAVLSLEDIRKMIKAEIPDAFEPKAKGAKGGKTAAKPKKAKPGKK